MLMFCEDILCTNSLMKKFPKRFLITIIHINQKTFNIIFATSKHEYFTKKAKYYGTEYDEIETPVTFKTLWDERKLNKSFLMQSPNLLMTTNYEIYPRNDDECTVSQNTNHDRNLPDFNSFLTF